MQLDPDDIHDQLAERLPELLPHQRAVLGVSRVGGCSVGVFAFGMFETGAIIGAAMVATGMMLFGALPATIAGGAAFVLFSIGAVQAARGLVRTVNAAAEAHALRTLDASNGHHAAGGALSSVATPALPPRRDDD